MIVRRGGGRQSPVFAPDQQELPGPRMMTATDAMSKLFPSRGSLAVFVSYMLMFVAQGMLVTASRHGAASYSYNTVTVVLFTELLKLVMSSLMYLKE